MSRNSTGILILLLWFSCPRTFAQSPVGAPASSAHSPAQSAAFRHIPPDADAVYHVDLGAVLSKTSFSALEAPFLGSQAIAAEFGSIKSTMQQGIDLHSDLYLAVSNRYHPDSPKYITIVFTLMDPDKFIAHLRSQVRALRAPDGASPLPHGQGQVFTSSDLAVAWDQRHAVLVTREASHSSLKSFGIDVIRDINYRRALAAWRGYPNSYFMTDPDFRKAFSEKADAHIWNRHSSSFAALGEALRLTPLGAHLSGLYRGVEETREHNIGILRFDTGKISYRHIRLTTPQKAASITRLVNPRFDSTLVTGAPFGNIIGAATFHFDPSLLLDTLGKLKELLFRQKGLTLQDMSAALKGDCLLLAYDASADQHSAETIQMPDVFAVFSVRDTAAFRRSASYYRLTDAATAPDVDSSFNTPFHYYAVQNDIAVVTTTPAMARNYFSYSASASHPTGRVLSKEMQNGSFSLGLDMGMFSDFFISLTKGKDATTIEKARNLASVYRKMGVFTVSAGQVIGNTVVTDFDLTLADPKKNGLAGLLEIFTGIMSIVNNR